VLRHLGRHGALGEGHAAEGSALWEEERNLGTVFGMTENGVRHARTRRRRRRRDGAVVWGSAAQGAALGGWWEGCTEELNDANY
jgi:hypothetical protein